MKNKGRHTIFFLIFLMVHLFGNSQNLVPNPGFDDLNTFPPCWTSGSREDFSLYVKDWLIPNMGTTDLLSTQVATYCITAMPANTASPVNYFPKGSQMPRSGTNFAGIKPLNDSRREYLEVKLVCPLVPGEEYYAEMYVSLSENTNYAQNSLGMYFSDTLVYTSSFEMLPFNPQIVENNVIKDSLNWVKISGTFTATGPAQYLIIGSFATQANTIVEFLGNKGEINFPYYFIDDVKVIPVNLPPVTISGDTIVCKGDTVQLSASGWNDLSWTITPTPSLVLSHSNQLIFVPSSGGVVTAKSNYCNLNLSEEVNIVIAADPIVNIGKDTTICAGTSLLLNAGAGLFHYQWSNGSVSQTTNVSLPGTYSITAENEEGCKGEDEITVAHYKLPEVNLGSDQLICTPEGTLHAYTGQATDTYLWQDGSSLPELTYTEEGVYWVSITNICGDEDSDTLSIKKIHPYIPNLITPNKDHKNDQFQILDVENEKGVLTIYNRFGEQVYKSESYQNDFTGETLSEGVYFYSFIYPTCPEQKGWLQIIK